ncbi:MAG: DUF11 domain-containing protein [Chitinophagales bacterium]|nr:DUF11 domain-containing protein [Chitinophagales bacterium]
MQKKNYHFLKKVMIFLLVLSCFSAYTYAQVSGTVFRDFNSNGTKDNTTTFNEIGLAGLTITVYDAMGNSVGTTTSAADGTYTIAGVSGAVRVEFTMGTTSNCLDVSIDYPSGGGGSYGTSVQFVTAPVSNVNFAINNPADYSLGTSNANVFIPMYTAGDPLIAGGTSGTDDWAVAFPYNNSGTTTVTQKVNGLQIGATWGVAYSKQANKIFTAAFLKRHVGLGILGSGGIYMLTPTATAFTVSNFFDMDAPSNSSLATTSPVAAAPTRCSSGCPSFGLSTSYTTPNRGTVTFLGSTDPVTNLPNGFGVVGSNSARGLNSNKATPSRDPSSFDQVGKIGLGDLEISDDGRYLFVTNLYDRKIYRLELDNPVNPTHVVGIVGYDLPSTTVTNGVLRPFALKYYRGSLYVGAVATGETESSSSNTNLYAYVFELNDPTGSALFTSSSILAPHQLNYARGSANSGYPNVDRWYPWSKTPENFLSIAYPTPMLTDIEFSDRGDLILAFTDRTGHQYGHQNYRFTADPGYGDLVTAQIAGDILIAGVNCTTDTYTIESNGSYNSNGQTFSGGVGNTQGPNGGEFFSGENQNATHTETSQGALALLKGTGQVMLTNMNPTTTTFSGGTKLMSTTTGSSSNGYTLYDQNIAGEFGKANGLGDIEVMTSPAPLEIGNRVWNDTDGDGVQDAGEAGIESVQVQLYQGTTLVGTATTDANGNYYFNATNVNQNGATAVLPNTAYEVRLVTTQTPVSSLQLTTANTDVTTNGDARDSDASGTTTAVIALTTGDAGQNNHTYDFGFKAALACPDPRTDEIICKGIPPTTGFSYVLTTTLTGGTWSVSPTFPSIYIDQDPLDPAYLTRALGLPGGNTYTFTYNDGTCQDIITLTISDQSYTCASGIVVDTISVISNTTVSNSTVSVNAATYDAAGILGGEVDVKVEALTTLATYESWFAFYDQYNTAEWINGPGDYSKATITWDGNDNNANTLDATGLGGVDLTSGGNFGFNASADISKYKITLRVYTDAANYSESVFTMNSSQTQIYNIPVEFITFTTVGGIGADMTNVGAVQLIFEPLNLLAESNGIDLTIECFHTPCVIIPCNLTATATGTPVSCNGGSDGTASVTASGNLSPVTYLWNNGETTSSINGLTAGTYTVTVTESATCTAVAIYDVTQPPLMDITCTKTDVTTNGGSDGTASVNATGGTSPYTYLWSSGETTSSISGKTSGSYTVTVTDDNGCTAMCAQTITEPGVTPLPDLSLIKTVSNAIVALNGTVTFTLTLTNDNGVDATGVVVTDVLPAGVTFVSSSDPTNVGISGNTLTWNVGNMLGTDAPKMLDITVTANNEGSFLNNAEITDMNETDTDSTPNNDVAGEDDQDQACFSVPASLCSDSPTASITITATTVTTYQWYVSTDNGATYTVLSGETSQTLVVNNTLMGGNNITKYFKVAYNGSPITGACGDVMCCPIIITTQTCIVCPPPKCITIGITKH